MSNTKAKEKHVLIYKSRLEAKKKNKNRKHFSIFPKT